MTVKNKLELLSKIPYDVRKTRAILLAIVEHVLHYAKPEFLLAKHIRHLKIKKYRRIGIIAIGKAASAMANAATKLLTTKLNWVLYADTGHPLPTASGIKKTTRIMAAARQLTKDDLAIVLISGGGSAMFVRPIADISLADKITTTQKLLRCGATIQELNTVRKHLSQVKGGRLAKLLAPAMVVGFIISDVVGNDVSTIASGPLSPDPTTFQDVVKIIKKYKLKLPKRVHDFIQKGCRDRNFETPKAGDPCFKKVKLTIVADHTTSIRLAKEKAHELGVTTRTLNRQITGEARNAAQAFIKSNTKHGLTIASGETTVTCCKKPGYGGRNQEFVLSALRYLKPHQTIASIGTDGVDGICPERVAGALADAVVKETAQTKKLEVARFLKKNDSYSFFKQTSGLIKTGATGTNLGDLIVLVNYDNRRSSRRLV